MDVSSSFEREREREKRREEEKQKNEIERRGRVLRAERRSCGVKRHVEDRLYIFIYICDTDALIYIDPLRGRYETWTRARGAEREIVSVS